MNKKFGAAILFCTSCAPSQPATHPDHDSVTSAQTTWCTMMAKLDGRELAGWRYEKECLGAYPTGSSAYVTRLAGCYGKTMTDFGEDAPDSASVIDSCTLEIMAGADPGDVTDTDLFAARCERLERCDQVSPEVCASAWDRVDPTARALLTSMYNLRAQAEIARCLRDSACGENGEETCYATAREARVWLPLSLALDPTVGPKVD